MRIEMMMTDQLLLFLILSSLYLLTGAATGFDDPACVKDKTLPATEIDNYLDCKTDEQKEKDATDCCMVDTSVGCCNKSKRWKELLAICLGIGITFLILAFFCIYCFWCRKDTIPCLGKLQDFIQEKWYKAEEHLPCCASRVERRKQAKEIMARSKDQPALALPDEVAVTVPDGKDDWWRGQIVKS